VSRGEARPGISPDAVTRIFQVPAARLPAYTGSVSGGGGYSIYKVIKVIEPPAPDAGRIASAANSVGSQLGRELLAAYLASVRAGTEVKINQGALEKQQ
jgi:peptidyl-prolyl cis-trans isomerase D